MISPSEAHRLILHNAKLFPLETVPLEKAFGRVLRENIQSDRDQPPFNKSLTDGIAIVFDSWQKGARTFHVEAIVPPGISPKALKNIAHGVHIMTGAVIPKGCDCVIPIEQINLEGDTAQVRDWTMIKKNQFIRFQAADGKKGEILLKSGLRLWAPHIGVAASVGK